MATNEPHDEFIRDLKAFLISNVYMRPRDGMRVDRAVQVFSGGGLLFTVHGHEIIQIQFTYSDLCWFLDSELDLDYRNTFLAEHWEIRATCLRDLMACKHTTLHCGQLGNRSG